MTRKACGATLTLGDDTYRCDRPARHKGRHRERLYGADSAGQFTARVQWRRITDRRA